jgi:hypothetical protein
VSLIFGSVLWKLGEKDSASAQFARALSLASEDKRDAVQKIIDAAKQ